MENSRQGAMILAARCREIDKQLAALRHEQRLFRRLGFGENIQVMHIVALLAERAECQRSLRDIGVKVADPREQRGATGYAQAIIGALALAVGILVCIVRGAVVRRAPASRRSQRGEVTVIPSRLTEAGNIPWRATG